MTDFDGSEDPGYELALILGLSLTEVQYPSLPLHPLLPTNLIASHNECCGKSLLVRLCLLKSLGIGLFFLVVFLMRTTEALRTCCAAAAGARNRGIVGMAGRGVWRRDSLAMEAKQRSIGAILCGQLKLLAAGYWWSRKKSMLSHRL